MANFEVIYHDPSRKRGPAHTMHVVGCGDIPFSMAADKSGLASRRLLTATELSAALAEAQYQGLEPSDGTDLGDVHVAPCCNL